ncbi:MAG: hypothetical protein WCK55_10185 [Verrucomicrobiota bacterium]
MDLIVAILFWSSLALLSVTKAADVVTTIRHVGEHGESNPLARAWFARFGFTGGLLLVCAIYSVLAVGQYVLVWWTCGIVGRSLNTVCGLAIAWIQWDVARFNATGRHSRITMLALRAYSRWARWWRAARGGGRGDARKSTTRRIKW